MMITRLRSQYKESPFLDESLRSLINQTVKRSIIIVTSIQSVYNGVLAEKYNIVYFVTDNHGLFYD
jgi:hypothetical protein